MPQAKKALLTLLRSPKPSGPQRPGPRAEEVKAGLLQAFLQHHLRRVQEGKRPCVQPSASGQRFPRSDPDFKDFPQKATRQPLPVARAGQCFPGVSLQSVFLWSKSTGAQRLLARGLERVFCPSQPVTSGLLCDPTSSHSHSSLRIRAPLFDHSPQAGTPGCSQTVFLAEPQSMLPPPGRRQVSEREVGLHRLPITPSFSGSKTHLLKPLLGSLIFAWLYISSDIWTEIARKRL